MPRRAHPHRQAVGELGSGRRAHWIVAEQGDLAGDPLDPDAISWHDYPFAGERQVARRAQRVSGTHFVGGAPDEPVDDRLPLACGRPRIPVDGRGVFVDLTQTRCDPGSCQAPDLVRFVCQRTQEVERGAELPGGQE